MKRQAYYKRTGMDFFYEKTTYLFDALQDFWENDRVHIKLSIFLVCSFVTSVILIELNREHILPPSLTNIIPTNHFFAVGWSFTIILTLEVLSLIFVLPCSFSRSIGKQFELLSLILLRDAFKELAHFPEPISFIGNEDAILRILSDGFGALLVFALLGVYYMVQRHEEEQGQIDNDLYRFVAAKKSISLFLLVCFIYLGINNLIVSFTAHGHADFFHNFYTLLIIADILIVLTSQCFHPSFFSVFRNSGYALSTMFIRLALVAPAYYNVLLGVAAISFAIILTTACNKLFSRR